MLSKSFTGWNMAKAADSYRYERKFTISELSRHEIREMIRLHPALFLQIYPPRFVNNVYLDSVVLKNYFDTVDGVAERVKIRIRWYGGLFGLIEKPVLEFKIKKGLVGTKKSYPMDPFSLDGDFSSETVACAFQNSDIPEVRKLQLTMLKPTLLNRYHRRYYRSADGNYRVTLDSDMEFYSVGTDSNSHLRKYADFSNTVLELKYDRDKDQAAQDIVNLFSFRMTRNSKYLNGIEKTIL